MAGNKEAEMKPRQSVEQRIQDIVSRSPGCSLDDIIQACPDFSWNQIFGEIDTLTRGGALILKREGSLYRFSLRGRSEPSTGQTSRLG
jgi:hypothetical protein